VGRRRGGGEEEEEGDAPPAEQGAATQLTSSWSQFTFGSSSIPGTVTSSVPPPGARTSRFVTLALTLWLPGTNERQPFSGVQSSSANHRPIAVEGWVVKNVWSSCEPTLPPTSFCLQMLRARQRGRETRVSHCGSRRQGRLRKTGRTPSTG